MNEALNKLRARIVGCALLSLSFLAVLPPPEPLAAPAQTGVAAGVAQQQGQSGPAQAKVEKNRYQQIEITKFEVKEGVEFPPDYLADLTNELAAQLRETEKFRQVSREGEAPAEANAPALKLSGTVTEFKAGNRAVRYMVGFGAGRTKVKAHVKFTDRATGEVLYEGDVDGKVIMGVFGGDSRGATRGLAKEVAKVARQQFFSR
jgi:hypothetical protein